MTREHQPSAETASAPEARAVSSFSAFARLADYSLLETLRADPQASADGRDHRPRQVRSGHYVPVTPTPLPQPEYVAHSSSLFGELGLSEELVHDDAFRRLFSGDISAATGPMRPYGWATGYALSIYGTEYIQQCPFGTGNGYGDGRAISVFEGLFEGRRWELQLKGAGPTPYCRGADGRAVLRSSVREFLAQELMHALGVPTSRSLTLYMSAAETVRRPWYAPDSQAFEPDVMVDNPAAITTRVAPSFLRVGQLELFARRARSGAHAAARMELQMIVTHLIERNYRSEINAALPWAEQVVELARLFRGRLTALVADWIRVGYCQGNFNSDNCAAAGFTLDYGPFGFCEGFDPRFQPWTGGGEHFCFFNQPAAAEANFQMFWSALRVLLDDQSQAQTQLDQIRDGFTEAMGQALEAMWTRKLGLPRYDAELVQELLQLMASSQADYTILFRRLTAIAAGLAAGHSTTITGQLSALQQSFYRPASAEGDNRWSHWLSRWRDLFASQAEPSEASAAMHRANPAVTWREWLIAPAYQQAAQGDFSAIRELHAVFSRPYDDLPAGLAATYDRLRPQEFSRAGGIAHYSCSS